MIGTPIHNIPQNNICQYVENDIEVVCVNECWKPPDIEVLDIFQLKKDENIH